MPAAQKTGKRGAERVAEALERSPDELARQPTASELPESLYDAAGESRFPEGDEDDDTPDLPSPAQVAALLAQRGIAVPGEPEPAPPHTVPTVPCAACAGTGRVLKPDGPVTWVCEEHPELSLNLSRAPTPPAEPRIQFRQGRHTTDDADTLAALEWAANNGHAPIFEDDGLVAHKCGLCSYATVSPGRLRAHRRYAHRTN
jgi:hypothetical protein